jgi:hypothetical protein
MQPLQSTNIKLQGPFMDLVSRNGELSTAWSAYNVWHVVDPKNLFPRIRNRVFGSSVPTIVFFAEGLNVVWTARDSDATKIGITIALYKTSSERRQAFDVRITLCIRMPCPWIAVFVSMYKRYGGGKLFVIFYQLRKIDISLAPFVS